MLLELLNFDLLEQFSFLEVPYDPRIKYVNEYTPNMGFVGFDSCSIVLNIGTLVWLLLVYVLKLIGLMMYKKINFINKCFTKKKIRKNLDASYNENFYNGLISQLNDLVMVLLFSSILRLYRGDFNLLERHMDIDSYIMLAVLIMIPIFYTFLGFKAYKNFTALCNKKSD